MHGLIRSHGEHLHEARLYHRYLVVSGSRVISAKVFPSYYYSLLRHFLLASSDRQLRGCQLGGLLCYAFVLEEPAEFVI